uniref:Uncharacterized protein n=1 Tax=Arundo donax TaxID=35708 RepID=A0A0A9AL69_ARUDO
MPLGALVPRRCKSSTTEDWLAYRYLNFLSFTMFFGKDSRRVWNASSTSKFCSLPISSGRISISVCRRPKKRKLNKSNTSSGNVLI